MTPRARRRGAARVCWAVAVALATGCASSPVRLPRGEGEAFPTYDEAVREATSACRGVRTLSAELSVSGRSGPDRVRGHVAAGLARPSGLRLEGAAPFGPPAFILVSDASGATLLLPRDHRVLTGTSSAEILEALVGLRLAPDDLMALLTGCVVPDPRAVAGRRFGGGWAAADVGQGASLYLREGRDGRWVVRAAVRPPMTIEYRWGGRRAPRGAARAHGRERPADWTDPSGYQHDAAAPSVPGERSRRRRGDDACRPPPRRDDGAEAVAD